MLDDEGNLEDPRGESKGGLIQRSALGLVAVYSLMPLIARRNRNVDGFHTPAQTIVKERLQDSCEDLAQSFAPRIPLLRHPHGLT